VETLETELYLRTAGTVAHCLAMESHLHHDTKARNSVSH